MCSTSLVVYRVKGFCTGNHERWFYDPESNSCRTFNYGGCFGNSNRFLTRADCEETCGARHEDGAEAEVCGQARDPGPCRGHFARWSYDAAAGQCEQFRYGGCGGNRNRFVTLEQCQTACNYKKQIFEVTVKKILYQFSMWMSLLQMCSQPLVVGSCNQRVARWGFDPSLHTCTPFYYSGCGGNNNNFLSRAECRRSCPDVRPPSLEMDTASVTADLGQSVILRVNIRQVISAAIL